MTIEDSQNWFAKLDIDTANDLSISCPRCKHPYKIGMLFDEEFRKCENCKASLVEWNLIRFVYLIDVDKSPKVVQHLANYVRSLNADEGYKQLEILHNLLGVEFYE